MVPNRCTGSLIPFSMPYKEGYNLVFSVYLSFENQLTVVPCLRVVVSSLLEPSPRRVGSTRKTTDVGTDYELMLK